MQTHVVFSWYVMAAGEQQNPRARTHTCTQRWREQQDDEEVEWWLRGEENKIKLLLCAAHLTKTEQTTVTFAARQARAMELNLSKTFVK